MSKRIRPILVLFFALSWSNFTYADTINFDDGTTGSAIGAFYLSRGVTFSNVRWYPNQDNTDNPFSGTSGSKVVVAISTGTTPKVDDPLIAIFSTRVTNVSLVASDLGGNGAKIDAYDAPFGGNLIESTQFIGTGAGLHFFRQLSLTSANIRRIEFYQPLSVTGDGVVWDDLKFTPIPEPSTALLVLLVLAATGVACRSTHRKRSG